MAHYQDVHVIYQSYVLRFLPHCDRIKVKKPDCHLISRMFRQIVNRRYSSCLRLSDHFSSPRYETVHHFPLCSQESQSKRFSSSLSQPCLPLVSPFLRPLTSCRAMSSSSKDSPEENVSVVKKFKQMIKDYWYVLIPVHVATSVVW